MPLMSLNVYRTERASGTQVLACSATDATLCVYYGYLRRLVVLGIHVHHQYGSRRTMAGTVAAAHAVGHRQTVFLYPHCMTDADGRLLRHGYRMYGSSRTYLRTTCTLGATVAILV